MPYDIEKHGDSQVTGFDSVLTMISNAKNLGFGLQKCAKTDSVPSSGKS
jgi:hypothetical protein